MTNKILLSQNPPSVSFSDTQIAFAGKSDKELKFSYFIFRMMGNRMLVSVSSSLALFALKLRLPVLPLIKSTVFKQFCGGENMVESRNTAGQLGKAGIGAILDYSVEGTTDENIFEETKNEIIRAMNFAKNNPHIPFACMKPTGIGRFELLEKISSGAMLNAEEKTGYENIRRRLDEICAAAFAADRPVYIDAEESWIQGAIDSLAEEMMRKYNRAKAVVFTTLQMYRRDKLVYLKKLIELAKKEKFILGAKIVRGAYLEKETARAVKSGYPAPMNPSKSKTDSDYNEALRIVISELDSVEFCAGTHNEESCMLLAELMKEKNLANNHPHIYFSQLYGMSDHISYNLAAAGFNVTKYLPYGPVHSAIPYLIRRAQENTAIAGQMSKELKLIIQEIQRRKL